MPLTPTYRWSETINTVEVLVQVVTRKEKADILVTNWVIKINVPPYLLILDLIGEVDESQSSAVFIPEGIVFKLAKKENGFWNNLTADSKNDDIIARRNKSFEDYYFHVKVLQEQRLKKKQADERAATDRQIEVERRKRAEVEARKAEELAAERSALQDWKKGLGNNNDAEDDSGSDLAPEDAQEEKEPIIPDHPDYYGRGWRPQKGDSHNEDAHHGDVEPVSKEEAGKSIWVNDELQEDAESRQNGHVSSSSNGKAAEDPSTSTSTQPLISPVSTSRLVKPQPSAPPAKPHPPPRQVMPAVKMDFTPTEIGHLPMREGREEEIRAYKAQAARPNGKDGEYENVADRQPLFLKDKGDALFKQGNYRGAVNAYTRALELDPECLPALTNRSACHLKLGDYPSVIDDCDAALEKMEAEKSRIERGNIPADEVESHKRQRVKLLLRRGRALLEQRQRTEALADYNAALLLDPSNAQIQADVVEVSAMLNGGGSDAASLKIRGEARFKAGDAEGAAAAFGALSRLPETEVSPPDRISALSNRAACLIQLERFEDAVADCQAALDLAATRVLGLQYPTSMSSWIDSLPQSTVKDLSSLAQCSTLCDNSTASTANGIDMVSKDRQCHSEESAGGNGVITECSPLVDQAAAYTLPSNNSTSQHSHFSHDEGLERNGNSIPTVSSSVTAPAHIPHIHPETSKETAETRTTNESATVSEHFTQSTSRGSGEEIQAGVYGSTRAETAATVLAALDKAALLSVSRLLTRSGAALGHLRRYAQGAQDYSRAVSLLQVVGEEERAQKLAADMETLLRLANEQSGADS